jgi:hypothetical protein
MHASPAWHGPLYPMLDAGAAVCLTQVLLSQQWCVLGALLLLLLLGALQASKATHLDESLHTAAAGLHLGLGALGDLRG